MWFSINHFSLGEQQVFLGTIYVYFLSIYTDLVTGRTAAQDVSTSTFIIKPDGVSAANANCFNKKEVLQLGKVLF